MADSDREARIAEFRETCLREQHEENERLEREAAIDRCDQCPYAKIERNDSVKLSNGLCLASHSMYCRNPSTDCTAEVGTYLKIEPVELNNRIVEWLVEQTELKAVGVSWTYCLMPDAPLMLTYRVPASELVARVVGAVCVEPFRV